MSDALDPGRSRRRSAAIFVLTILTIAVSPFLWRVPLAMLLSACEWGMYGWGPGHTGWNLTDPALSADTVDTGPLTPQRTRKSRTY